MLFPELWQALRAIGCTVPAIRQGFGGLTFGRFNPLAPVNPTTREGWEERYGLPWGSRGDHSAGAAVAAEYAARPDNPLKLVQPYVMTETDRADANLLGTPNGTPSYEVMNRLFQEDTPVVEPTKPCPGNWVCTEMPEDVRQWCVENPDKAVAIRGVKAVDPHCYLDSRNGSFPRVYYNALRPECNPTLEVVPPIIDPPVEPPTPPVDDKPDLDTMIGWLEEVIAYIKEQQ